MVSSALRGVLQTMIAILVLNEVVSYMRWLGILLTVSGGVFYSWFKHLESLKTFPIQDEERGFCSKNS